MQRLLERRYKLAAGSGGSADVRQWTTARRRLLLEAGTIAGRPVVILEDKPLGAAARILTLDRVTLQEP